MNTYILIHSLANVLKDKSTEDDDDNNNYNLLCLFPETLLTVLRKCENVSPDSVTI